MVISDVNANGRFKRKLNERCVECGGNLELRTVQESYIWDGEEFSVPVDKKICSVCGGVTETEKETRHWKKRRGNLEV